MKLKLVRPDADFIASWGCSVSRLHIFTEPSLVAVMMALYRGTLSKDTTIDAKLPNLHTDFRFLDPRCTGCYSRLHTTPPNETVARTSLPVSTCEPLAPHR